MPPGRGPAYAVGSVAGCVRNLDAVWPAAAVWHGADRDTLDGVGLHAEAAAGDALPSTGRPVSGRCDAGGGAEDTAEPGHCQDAKEGAAAAEDPNCHAGTGSGLAARDRSTRGGERARPESGSVRALPRAPGEEERCRSAATGPRCVVRGEAGGEFNTRAEVVASARPRGCPRGERGGERVLAHGTEARVLGTMTRCSGGPRRVCAGIATPL